jgi:hypothetical protein
MGKMVIQILAAVAEAERERILGAQTKAGSSPWRQASGLDGNLITNRPPHWSLSGETPIKLVMEKTGISRATYFRLNWAQAVNPTQAAIFPVPERVSRLMLMIPCLKTELTLPTILLVLMSR